MWIRKNIRKHGECLKTSKNVFPPKRGRECINKGESRKGNSQRGGIDPEKWTRMKRETNRMANKWNQKMRGLQSRSPHCLSSVSTLPQLQMAQGRYPDNSGYSGLSGYVWIPQNYFQTHGCEESLRDDWSQHISTTLPVILRRSNPFEVIEAVHMKATTHKTLPRVVRCQKIRVILVSAGNVWATYTRLMAYRPPFCGVAPWHRTGTLWCFSESRPKICRRPFLGSAGSSWCPKCEFCDWDEELLIVGSS